MRFKLLKLHLFVYLVCVFVCMCKPASMHQNKSVEVREQLWKSFISFYHVSPGDWTGVVKLGSKLLYSLSNLASPLVRSSNYSSSLSEISNKRIFFISSFLKNFLLFTYVHMTMSQMQSREGQEKMLGTPQTGVRGSWELWMLGTEPQTSRRAMIALHH